MAAEVIYKAAAEAEIEIVFREYESQRNGLGTRFLDELHRIEGHLRLNPALYQRVDSDYRTAANRPSPSARTCPSAANAASVDSIRALGARW